MDPEPASPSTLVEETIATARARPTRVPVSTYRLQLHGGFRFTDAARVVPYLARLGVTDCYCSPYMNARPGSTHGYDITNHNELNPEVGSAAEYEQLAATLRDHGMGQILDFVPNHMGIDPRSNPWWKDVLENGSCSPFALFFDVDWNPVKMELQGKILLPILGAQYGQVLERGELQLGFADGEMYLDYFDHRLPINPRRSPKVLRHSVERLAADLGEGHPDLHEFLSIMSALHNMPAYTESDPERIAERQREKTVARDRLVRLVDRAPRVREHIEEAIRIFNGEPGVPETFDLLHDLLEAQPYRLSYWRTASHEINYRRFFDINELAGLRMEDATVFEATHQLVARLLSEGKVTGLRIDHPDGLFDPRAYFVAVQDLARRAGATTVDRPLYLLAEKILSAREQLPGDWPIHGTTGYDFMNEVNGLFVQQENARSLTRIYRQFSRHEESFADVLYASKGLMMETALASELNVLAHALNRISEGDRRSRDFTLLSLRDVVKEVVACFPVYRTYTGAEGWTAADRERIETGVRRARARNPAVEPSIFDFLREVLLPRHPDRPEPEEDRRSGYPPRSAEDYDRRLFFSRKFQQYTAPVQAKGVEDTAFYRYNVLLSLNEVGGDPGRFGRTPAEFHEQNVQRLERWPYGMTATATHDSKLGEDVRARISAISELVNEWRRELSRWTRINAAHRTTVDGEPAPDRNDEYRLYQVLAGAWPGDALASRGSPVDGKFVSRIREYMLKAIKEAKVHTSWINDNKAYDAAVGGFVEGCLTGSTAPRFLATFLPFAATIARLGVVNSLAQVVLKVASPGVPDFYRGTETWDLNLVDPDNRRPVDFDAHAALLERLEPLLPSLEDAAEGERPDTVDGWTDMLASWADGRAKLFVTTVGLRLRRARPGLFIEGRYLPLEAEMAVPAGLVAFSRSLGNDTVMAVVPRLVASITGPARPFPLGLESWRTSRIFLPSDAAARAYRNLLTGERTQVVRHRQSAWIFAAEVFKSCPVALLVPVESA